MQTFQKLIGMIMKKKDRQEEKKEDVPKAKQVTNLAAPKKKRKST